MKPTTVINIIMYITACLALLCTILVAGAAESRVTALNNAIWWKNAEITRLTEDNIKLKTLDGAVRVFDLFLPESYRAELAQLDFKLQQMKIRYRSQEEERR